MLITESRITDSSMKHLNISSLNLVYHRACFYHQSLLNERHLVTTGDFRLAVHSGILDFRGSALIQDQVSVPAVEIQ